MVELLGEEDLPIGFAYPRAFLRMVDLEIVNLEPWQILLGDQLKFRNSGLIERYPQSPLVPFARRLDNDDVACWDLGSAKDEIQIVHDFASPGWERRARFEDFNAWLRQAIEDFIEFE